jgi:hypothetical protein
MNETFAKIVLLVFSIITYSCGLANHSPSGLESRVGITEMREFVVTDPSGLHGKENLSYITKNMILDHLALACAEDWCNGDWMVQFDNITCYSSKSMCFLEMSFINNENEKNIKQKTCSIVYPHARRASFFNYTGSQADTLKVEFYDLVDQCIDLAIKAIEQQALVIPHHHKK